MPIQPILQGDIPELRQISQPVTQFDNQLAELVADLMDTLEAHRGLGLSAPQIGRLQNVFVADTGDGVQVFVNPTLHEPCGSAKAYESCLSFPDHALCIERPTRVMVRAQDIHGTPFEVEATGLLARVVCHEYDHLQGVLFIDYLSEEELFEQLLTNAYVVDDDETATPPQPPTDTDAVAGAIAEESRQERQMVVDMLAEVSWKLVLTIDMLREDATGWTDGVNWRMLNKASQALEATVDLLSERLSTDGRLQE
ncbi:peptide deformylase [Alicyclobacillus sacchari]|uniref:Peptide deformylase n=1 Tax=Alicyclobacillus sacchari TaxID=392010 RepID=A0A4R8LNV3_9BACL|nr:peptide deformylase [Alicyclobacillus sacchari]TDY47951.1 peptide deformylase [Alicyclobacillus sacchari]